MVDIVDGNAEVAKPVGTKGTKECFIIMDENAGWSLGDHDFDTVEQAQEFLNSDENKDSMKGFCVWKQTLTLERMT